MQTQLQKIYQNTQYRFTILSGIIILMTKNIKIAVFLFISSFAAMILRDRYIGEEKTFHNPLNWNEIYENIPMYLFFSFLLSVTYLYIEHRKNNK
ncbi:MAG: hypothetical protein A2X11_11215 [Bacteroidetes bacterium GWE2_42_24]|nr:MAG: hypothetical protein A2X11_11215 [Bacteroidetes bacterium GWE2_42_24]